MLRGLHRELGLTVVMVTHDLDTLFDLSTRIAVLADQKVIVAGTAVNFSTKGPTPLGGGCEYMVCDDRSCRPLSSPGQTPIATCPAVQALRRQRYIARAKAANTPIIGPKHSEKETPELIEN